MVPSPSVEAPNPGWAAVIRAALLMDDGESVSGHVSPESIATAVAHYPPDAAYDRSVFLALHQLTRNEVERIQADEAPQLAAGLVRALDHDTLSRLLRAAKAEEQRHMMRLAADGFDPEALIDMVLAAASALRRPPTPAVQRMLRQLADRAASTGADNYTAERLLRKQVERFVDQWWMIAEQSGSAATLGLEVEQADDSRLEPEPERIVDIALETAVSGTAVWRAVRAMTDTGQETELLQMLVNTPGENSAATAITQHLATPTRLRELLKSEPIDFHIIDQLLAFMDATAAEPLLAALVESRSRVARRALFDRVVRIGQDAVPAIVHHMKSDQWYVQRNMLALLAEMDHWPERLDIGMFAQHTDPRVRKEAFRLVLRMPAQRDAAIEATLRDSEWEVVRLGLFACKESVPKNAAELIAKRLTDPKFPEELDAAAARALAQSDSEHALAPLLKFASARRGLFGRRKLAPKSPAMLVALSGLARHWSRNDEVARLIARARSSQEPRIREAVSPPTAKDKP